MATQKKTKVYRAPTGKKSDSKARMEKFCVAYFAKANATEAAMKASYAARSFQSTGSCLL